MFTCCGKLRSSHPGSKEAKISKLISRKGEFISDRFSWKRMDLTEVGRKSWVKGKATCQVLCPEDLHSWWDGLRELHIDRWVKVVPAPHPPPTYHLNIHMCGGLLAQILILLQTTSCHPL